ncbi:glycosyl transferase family 1 [Synergistales bacterium]|nr:glycosyl transferase family 1 [Synergistales bacterium]
MTKLLIATTIPATIKSFLLPYADYFRAKGWRVGAMSNGAAKDEALAGHFDELINASWTRNPSDPGNFNAPPLIRDAVLSGGYDIVHVHTPVAAFLTRFALRGARAAGKIKIVYTAHGFHFHRGGGKFKNKIYSTPERMAGRWTDRLIVINRDDFDAAEKLNIAGEKQLRYMPGIGLDFSKYDPANVSGRDIAKVRGELDLLGDDILYTMAAEFNPGKRHRDAIEALAMTKRANIHIAFAGDGPLVPRMKELAGNLGVSLQIRFLGFRNDLNRIVMASRASLLASEREGLPRSLMESACLGIPIIGADARGISDVVTPERGILYPAGDTLALRDAMLRFAEEPPKTIKPDPAWRIENLISMHEELYGEL